MGEANRRKKLGLVPRNIRKINVADDSPKLINWLPITQKQKDKFIRLSIKSSWIGIGLLILLWIVVRFIGPAAGWWIPADTL